MKKNKKKDEKAPNPIIVTHHEARRDYFVIDTMEAGIVLAGCEVKSLRTSNASLSGSFARTEGNELFLYNLYIAPYAMGNRENPETKRPRKLLLHKQQILRVRAKMQEKGLALIPLKLYFNHGIVKVELAVCKGKNHYDKRQDMKKDSARREIDRAIKNRNRK
ncbi:MAG TPA: SsrA-binding protein SmpB [Candidatus Eisenbacteria bacterium]|jgi:SsrA-binding protein|nr:SsrA-binding protein SmpB [Candidatus Eisenbacteria bacterium]